jgi:hypothetical protein
LNTVVITAYKISDLGSAKPMENPDELRLRPRLAPSNHFLPAIRPIAALAAGEELVDEDDEIVVVELTVDARHTAG